MSCYEWEHGNFPLPAKEYSRFKKAFREAYNARQDRLLKDALLWWSVNQQTKWPKWKDYQGKPNHMEFYRKEEALAPYRFLYLTRNSTPKGANFGTLGFTQTRSTPRKPVRSDFPLVTNRDKTFLWEDFNIHFEDATKTVIWDVPECNHARDRAHEHPMARKFFALLRAVKWTTKRNGGKIVGNDEYNQEQSYEGGGANYVTMTIP